jgi:hypothetical protein
MGLEEMQGVRELESGKQVIQLEVDVSHKDDIGSHGIIGRFGKE